MAGNVFDELENVYSDVLLSLPEEFDYHDFILKLADIYQKLYISALAGHLDKDSPFMIVHGEMTRRLANYSHLIRKIGTKNSPDIFLQNNSAVIWKKL